MQDLKERRRHTDGRADMIPRFQTVDKNGGMVSVYLTPSPGTKTALTIEIAWEKRSSILKEGDGKRKVNRIVLDGGVK